MANVATLPIEADRYGACVRQIHVVGLDLTGVAMRAQVRLGGDTPGAPLVDLATVVNGNAEGLRLVGVTTADGLPTSHVELVINETTMEGLPYQGEMGSATELAWDWQVTVGGRKQRVARGSFTVTGDGVTGADNAPDNRPAWWGTLRSPAAGMRSGATLTFGEESITVRIDRAELLAPLRAGAEAARDSAAASAAVAAARAAAADLSAATALTATNMFPTIAAGLAATAADRFFTVAGDGVSTYAILYQKVNGAEIEKARYASKAAYEGVGGAALIRTASGKSVQTVLDYPNRISIKQFNPVGDGVADDTIPLQAAINAAKARGRGVMLSLEGLRLKHGPIDVNGLTNLTIAHGTLLPLTQATSRWTGGGLNSVTFRALRFEHTAGFHIESVINLVNCSNIVVEECEFHGCGCGVGIADSTNVLAVRNTLTQIGIYPRPAPLDPSDAGYGPSFNRYGYGIRFDRCSKSVIRENRLENASPGGGHVSDQSGGAGAFVLYECADSDFIDNVSINAPGQGHLATGEATSINVVKAVADGTFNYLQRGRNIRFLGGLAIGSNQEAFTGFGLSGVLFAYCQGQDSRFTSIEAWRSTNVTIICVRASERGMQLIGQIATTGSGAIHIVGVHTAVLIGFRIDGARANGVRIDGSVNVTASDGNIIDYASEDAPNIFSASGVSIGQFGDDNPSIMSSDVRLSGIVFRRTPKAPGNNSGRDIYTASGAGRVYIDKLNADGRAVTYGGVSAAIAGTSPTFVAANRASSHGGSLDRPTISERNGRVTDIGTAPKVILEFAQVAGTPDGFEVIVNGGSATDGGAAFLDKLLVLSSGQPVVIGSTAVGGAAARTYSASAGFLLLSMAAGSYAVRLGVTQVLSGSPFT